MTVHGAGCGQRYESDLDCICPKPTHDRRLPKFDPFDGLEPETMETFRRSRGVCICGHSGDDHPRYRLQKYTSPRPCGKCKCEDYIPDRDGSS